MLAVSDSYDQCYLQATLSPWSKITVFIADGSLVGGRYAEIRMS